MDKWPSCESFIIKSYKSTNQEITSKKSFPFSSSIKLLKKKILFAYGIIKNVIVMPDNGILQILSDKYKNKFYFKHFMIFFCF